jgi:hypothetical protein
MTGSIVTTVTLLAVTPFAVGTFFMGVLLVWGRAMVLFMLITVAFCPGITVTIVMAAMGACVMTTAMRLTMTIPMGLTLSLVVA